MTNFSHKRGLLAKIETTYGTDPTPTEAANAMLVYDLVVEPLAGETVVPNPAAANLRKRASIPYGTRVRVTFGVDAVRSNASGVAPPIGPLLRACGMQEVIASGNVDYRGISSGYESVSMYYNADDTRHIVKGARGTFSLAFQKGQLPRINFEFIGIYAAPTTVAIAAMTTTAFAEPAAVSNAATIFTLGGVALPLERLTINLANQLQHFDKPNKQAVEIVERMPAGEIVFEAEALATFNPFTQAANSALLALSLTHTPPGALGLVITSSAFQLERPGYTDIDGIRHITSPVKLSGWGLTAAQELQVRFAST